MINNCFKFIARLLSYNNISFIKDSFSQLDKLTKKIIKHGLVFCLSLSMLSLFVLATYNYSITYPLLFSIGFVMFKLSLYFSIEFIICGFVVDKIRAGII